MNNGGFISNSKLMLVTKELDRTPSGGRELLCKLNHDVLKEIYGRDLVVFELPRQHLLGMRSIVKAFRGHIDGLDSKTMDRALRLIRSENIGKVFVDGSNLGSFVKVVKARLPHVEVTVFFHNVEVRFFWGSLREKGSLRAMVVLIVNYLAERRSVRRSDNVICLSQRDGRLLQRVYGRSATHVSSMALADKMPADFPQCAMPPPEKFALFVGGVFYANRAGIAWFVKNVVPRIEIKTFIVGQGFEGFRQELERDGKVEVVGSVDELADWYRNAHFVIAPIFDGSGMKTKVAEALMFGKKVVGTPEAFSGYEHLANKAGWVCATADDFVAAIARAQSEVTRSFDPEMRALYNENHSFAAAKCRLAGILEPATAASPKRSPLQC